MSIAEASVPAVTSDPLLETLPGAIAAQQESPCIMRIGVVTQIIEGSQITVKISGSEVLVNCSYVFGQYFPLLGDRVVVFKQDSQWFCVGGMTGAVGSNNPLPNGSFEDGAVGVIPTGWSITIITSVAGVPTFLVASPGGVNITGVNAAQFSTTSVIAGTSQADVYSPTIPASAGSKWTAAYFLVVAVVGSSPPLVSFIEMFVQFLDVTATLISESSVETLSTMSGIIGPVYRRFNLGAFPAGYVAAPAGTNSVRIRLRGDFQLPATSSVSFFIDNVILRQVD